MRSGIALFLFSPAVLARPIGTSARCVHRRDVLRGPRGLAFELLRFGLRPARSFGAGAEVDGGSASRSISANISSYDCPRSIGVWSQ